MRYKKCHVFRDQIVWYKIFQTTFFEAGSVDTVFVMLSLENLAGLFQVSKTIKA